MKLSERTVAVLKNFQDINPQLLIKPGDQLRTIAVSRKILASAKVDQEFPSRFAINDLSKLQAAITLFNEPDIVIKDKYLIIAGDGRSLHYTFADEAAVVVPPEKLITLPSVDVKFSLTAKVLKDLKKAANVLGMPNISVVGDGKQIVLQTTNVKKPSSDVYSVAVGETDKKFRMVFKVENMKLLP
jgi:hypothetical protein